jgi:glycosyltransferase involved in cell wall biosynthesis
MLGLNEIQVSVVIPCYRCSSTIERAIDSVINQSKVPSEVILVDDASEDGTLDVLMRLEKKYPDLIRVHHFEVNRGAASARNAGWDLSTKSYIAFLDSDDAWHPRKIELQLAYMEMNPEVILSGHGYRSMDANGLPDWPVVEVGGVTIGKFDLLKSNKMVTPSIMIRRDTSFRFLTGRRYMEDQLFIFEVGFGGARIDLIGIDLVATYKRSYGVSGLSSSLWLMEMCELENYRVLYIRGKFSLFILFVVSVFSIVKFCRRVFLTYSWKLRGLV